VVPQDNNLDPDLKTCAGSKSSMPAIIELRQRKLRTDSRAARTSFVWAIALTQKNRTTVRWHEAPVDDCACLLHNPRGWSLMSQQPDSIHRFARKSGRSWKELRRVGGVTICFNALIWRKLKSSANDWLVMDRGTFWRAAHRGPGAVEGLRYAP